MKHSGSEDGSHPALNFIRDLEFFNPSKSLILPEVLENLHNQCFKKMQTISNHGTSFSNTGYCRSRNIYKKTSLKIRAIRDFWEGAKTLLLELAKLAFEDAFLVSLSAGVEKSFSYYR